MRTHTYKQYKAPFFHLTSWESTVSGNITWGNAQSTHSSNPFPTSAKKAHVNLVTSLLPPGTHLSSTHCIRHLPVPWGSSPALLLKNILPTSSAGRDHTFLWNSEAGEITRGCSTYPPSTEGLGTHALSTFLGCTFFEAEGHVPRSFPLPTVPSKVLLT